MLLFRQVIVTAYLKVNEVTEERNQFTGPRYYSVIIKLCVRLCVIGSHHAWHAARDSKFPETTCSTFVFELEDKYKLEYTNGCQLIAKFAASINMHKLKPSRFRFKLMKEVFTSAGR